MSQILIAVENYRAVIGELPAGESRDVSRALRGHNPQNHVFFECPAESISLDGSLLDSWGTPYKVYFSGAEAIIRSAGPNRRFDNAGEKGFDDLIRSRVMTD